MARSQNGWPALSNLRRRRLVVNGVEFLGGIVDNADVETVFTYAMEQYAARVEPLRNPGCWGFAYRANRNDPNALSNHSSGTAIDANAPAHPNGVPTAKTFTPAQIATCRAIVAEVDGVLRWGGDYKSTPDAMHWEVVGSAAEVAAVAARLRKPPPAPKPETARDRAVAIRRELTALIKASRPSKVREKMKAARNRLPK